jgi:hypothetical protein
MAEGGKGGEGDRGGGDAGGVVGRKQGAMDAVRSLDMLRRAVEKAAAREMRA